jgi:hypothetical protein
MLPSGMRDHEALFPLNENRTIWRYLDFTKFVSLLETQQLYFPRADQFEDPYEGTWSSAGVRWLRNSQQNGGSPPYAFARADEKLISCTDQMRKEMFISCWTASEHESAAMWKLYLKSNEGVAIRSDSNTLGTVLERSSLAIGISMVQYIDYDNTVISFRNSFFPFVHKRLSFAHESELRAIIWAILDVNQPQIQDGATSVSVEVAVEELVKSVRVSPTAPTWFGQLVEQVAQRYGLTAPVDRSTLYDRPLF